MESNGGAPGKHGGGEGTTVSSRPSDDEDMEEDHGQDDETVAGLGTNLEGVVVQERKKVKHHNDSIKVTVDVLNRRIE